MLEPIAILRTLRVVALLAALVCSAPAAAQPRSADEVARVHYRRGDSLVAGRRYAEAHAEFERGYQLSGRPLFLFNMAECSRQLGQLARARAEYERYLAADPEGRQAGTARARLAGLPAASAGPRPPAPPSGSAEGAGPAARAADPAVSGPEAHTALVTPGPRDAPATHAWWRRWPVWAGVGAAVVVTGAVLVIAGSGADDGCEVGCVDLR